MSVTEKQKGILINKDNDFEIRKIENEEDLIKNNIVPLDQETFLDFVPNIETVYYIIKEVIPETMIDNNVVIIR